MREYSATRIGVISDTHGLLRPEAIESLRGCEHIIHGGDIGGLHILDALTAIAPVTAVRGNNDVAPWAMQLNATEMVEVQNLRLYVIHNLSELSIDPRGQGIRVVISGHSHKPRIEQREGVLFVNPGSAGPRRFKLPISLAVITVERPGAATTNASADSVATADPSASADSAAAPDPSARASPGAALIRKAGPATPSARIIELNIL